MAIRSILVGFAALSGAATALASDGPSAPPPTLTYAFTVSASLAPPVEQGEVDSGRTRFIPITGGTVSGPALNGRVMAGGGEWLVILPGGL
ncbi:MAG: DUF3237 family protein, partial [Novosphingobium sp.]